MPAEDGGVGTGVRRTRVFVAALAAVFVGLLGYNTLPLLLGAIIDHLGVDAGRAGGIGSLEIGVMAVTGVALAPFVDRISLRRLAFAGGVAAVLAHGCSTIATDLVTLGAARMLAGAAGGSLYAAANAAIAAVRDPDRLYAQVTFVSALGAAALFAGLPLSIDRWGLAGAFGPLAAVSVLGLPVLLALPRLRSPEQPSALEEQRPIFVRATSLSILAAGFVLAVGENALWAFTERIGGEAGLSGEDIGLTLAVTTVVGTVGAVVAAGLGVRVGRTLPVVLGLLAIGAASVVIAGAARPAQWIGGQLAYNTLYLFLTPYLLGTAAALDPAGRVAAGLGGITMVGGAFGPLAGGLLVEGASYSAVGWFVMACCVASVALVAPLTLRLDRAARVDGRAAVRVSDRGPV